MSINHKINTSKTTLVFGFGIILLFLLIAVVTGHFFVDDVVQSQDEIVHIHNVKKDLSLKMWGYAQRRFLGVSRMMHTDDIFEIEDLKMERLEAGAYFIDNMERMGQMPLTQEEAVLLDELLVRVTRAANTIDHVILLIEDAQLEKAINAFDNEGQFQQKSVYDLLTQFAQLQASYVRDAVKNTQIKKRKCEILQYVLAVLFTIVGILLAYKIICRITATENQLANERKQALTTLSKISDSVISVNANAIVDYINPRGVRLLNSQSKNLVGQSIDSILKIQDEHGQIIPLLLLGDEHQESVLAATNSKDLILVSHHEQQYFIELEISELTHEITHVLLGHVIVIKDVTQKRKAEKSLELQAKTDFLTGLTNRSSFDDSLTKILAESTSEQSHFIFFMDLDRFKIVNDTCGHIAGDELLKQVAVILKQKSINPHLLARLGGDEFSLILKNCSLSEAQTLATTIIDTISTFRFVWEGEVFSLGISIGIARVNTIKGETTEDILKAADTACFRAKDKGRNTYCVYNSADIAIAQRAVEMNWSNRLLNAVADEKFVLFGQKILPLPSCQDNCEYFVEVLIRYNDNGKLVLPNAFIPAAERYHLMGHIDRYVIEKVFSSMTQWPAHFLDNVKICINLSGQSIGDVRMRDFIIEKIKKYRVKPGKICFEITETAAIANLSEARDFIEALKKFKCQFSLDDFGSGLSSFAYLQTLPIDYLKIDGGLVRQIADDHIQYRLVESVHQIGELMGIRTVAEYVENKRVLKAVTRIGIHYSQGFHKAKPVLLKDIVADSAIHFAELASV